MKAIIHIYDIQKTCNHKGADKLGLGIYHSGIEIDGTEFAYGGNSLVSTTGLYEIFPKSHQSFDYKTSVDLGIIPV
jgi:hypothetical protein